MVSPAALTVLQSFGAITDAGVALIASQGRSIGGIVPNVTMEETGTDTLTTTDHPVETGVAVSDHSFRNPAELEMRVLWSDSSAQSVGYSIAVYNELLALQNQRQPFVIQTGKRTYGNMLFRSLTQKTDPTSEYSLTIVATFRELITVSSASAAPTSSTSPSVSSDQSTQTDPQSTSPTVDGGTGTSFSTIGTDSSTLFGQMGAGDVGGTPVSQDGASGAQVSAPTGATSTPLTGSGIAGGSGGEIVLPPVQISK